MSKGDFDSPSHPATDAYRENWQRIWGKRQDIIDEPRLAEPFHAYPNGCPILEGEDK